MCTLQFNSIKIYKLFFFIAIFCGTIFLIGSEVVLAGGGGSSGGSSGGSNTSPTYTKDKAAATASAQGYTNLSSALSNNPTSYSAVSTYSSSAGWGYSVQKNEPYKSDGNNSSSNSTQTPTPNLLFSQPATGNFDNVYPSTCTVTGWAYDPDNAAASIAVHIYKDGRAGVGTFVTSCQANQLRPDVNSIIRIPGNHGFNCELPNSYRNTGNHGLFIHAIDINGTPHNLLRGNGKAMSCTGNSTTVTPNPTPTPSPLATATLTGTDCVVASGLSTCASSMSWNIQNASNPIVRNVTTSVSYPDADKIMINVGRQINFGSNIIRSVNGSEILKEIVVNASCPQTAPWNSVGNVCFPTLNVSTEKPITRQNTTVAISWSISDSIPVGYSCAINGAGLTSFPVTTQNGSVESGVLASKSKITLSCTNNTTFIVDTTIIEIIPQVQEV